MSISLHIHQNLIILYIPYFKLYFLSKPYNTEHLPSIYLLNVLTGDISKPLLVLDFAFSSKCHPYPLLTLKTSPTCMWSSVQHSGSEEKGQGHLSVLGVLLITVLSGGHYYPSSHFTEEGPKLGWVS